MAEENYKIKVQNVTKEYDMFKTQSDKLKSFFSLSKKNKIHHFWSLMGISFTVQPGEALGIIGVNGSGKSTISNIISGIIPQTTGQVDVRGDTSIVAINAGLRKNLTGRENIRMKSLMQGLTNRQIDDMMDDIIAFADIGDFVDQPVKDYSSGMRSRLGFSIAVHIKPDILIIDEALSVGDDTFYQKCVDKIDQFKEEGKTIIFVSHSLKQVRLLCDRVAWINYGKLREIGPMEEVVSEYQKFIKWFKSLSKKEKKQFQKKEKTIQKNFDIDKYQKEITQEYAESHPQDHNPAKTIHKRFYSEVMQEKMPWTAKILTWVVLFAMVFFCLVNVSGHPTMAVVRHPSYIVNPSKKMRYQKKDGKSVMVTKHEYKQLEKHAWGQR